MWPWSKTAPKSEISLKLDAIMKRRDDITGEMSLLEEELDGLDGQIQSIVLEIVQQNKEGVPHLCREEEGEAYSAEDFAVGYHECTGPIGICIYDTVSDYGSDCCIFCGHPEERK